ncbi:MAG TPA: cell division protein FtsQ/DivIB [Gallionellaceae bacterium]|nr:cell division protein FtsQ/DivIB [Gallionellaceae bacterium]
MWDKPHLLRIAGNTLFAISFVLLAYGGLRYVLQMPGFNLRSVQLTSVPQHVDVELVNKVVKNAVRGGFFSVNLEQTRRAFEQLPWVRKVNVRRKFPWSLEVSLEEHVALARWNSEGELVNTHGEVFVAQSSDALPGLIGQPDTSHQVAEMYADLGQQLSGIGKIAQLSLSPRFAWQVRLDNGLVLDLGREQVLQRVARFVHVYPYSLAARASALNRVDLRYRNGFAVSFGARATTRNAGTGSQRVRL